MKIQFQLKLILNFRPISFYLFVYRCVYVNSLLLCYLLYVDTFIQFLNERNLISLTLTEPIILKKNKDSEKNESNFKLYIQLHPDRQITYFFLHSIGTEIIIHSGKFQLFVCLLLRNLISGFSHEKKGCNDG